MTNITVGNVVFVDETDSPTFGLDEHDRTGTVVNRLLPLDGSVPNYNTTLDRPRAQLNNDLLIYGTRDSTNTGRCIFKIARDGTLSDFILNAALATVETAMGVSRPEQVIVDATGRIYVIYIKFDGSTGTAMRFNPDGTHDTDFTIGRVTLGGAFSSVALEHHLDGGGWTISPDGQYIYGFQFSIEAFTHHTEDHHSLYRWDTTAGMTTALIYDYVETVALDGGGFPTGEFNEDRPYRALGYNVPTDELFVTIQHQHKLPGLSSNYSMWIDRITIAGALVQRYPIDTLISGWDYTRVNQFGFGRFGLNFGFDTVGNGHAWVFIVNRGQTNDHTWVMSLDLGTGAVAVMANYVDSFQDENSYLLIYTASGFPGLALYPAAADSAPVYGPALTL